MRRLLAVGCIAIAATLMSAQPVAAHGGSEADLTSDYRTRVTEVPDIDGLDARAVGIDGTIRLSWTGPGTLVVAGYEDEPYLRFDDTGVAVNMRSPAAYLNQDRYANVAVPAVADPTAEPDWQPAAPGNAYEWHDHRTHWMTRTPPPQAQQDPERSHVIYERWEIPLDIDGLDDAIAGDLTWAPAPPLWPWLGLTVLAFLAATALLWSRAWRPSSAALAAIGTVALVIDTAGFVAAINDNLANKTWAFVYAIVCLLATVRLIVHARRRTPDPTLAMMTAGLVLAGIGGLDRFDVLTSGFYQSELDITAARIATITCPAIGLALLSRFLRFLIPLLIQRQPTTTGIIGRDAPTTAQVD
jgi:hypothetical protein